MLNYGMLWRFDSPSDIHLALEYFEIKYDVLPNLCAVNIEDLKRIIPLKGIKFKPDRYINKSHILIGIKNKSKQQVSFRTFEENNL